MPVSSGLGTREPPRRDAATQRLCAVLHRISSADHEIKAGLLYERLNSNRTVRSGGGEFVQQFLDDPTGAFDYAVHSYYAKVPAELRGPDRRHEGQLRASWTRPRARGWKIFAERSEPHVAGDHARRLRAGLLAGRRRPHDQRGCPVRGAADARCRRRRGNQAHGRVVAAHRCRLGPARKRPVPASSPRSGVTTRRFLRTSRSGTSATRSRSTPSTTRPTGPTTSRPAAIGPSPSGATTSRLASRGCIRTRSSAESSGSSCSTGPWGQGHLPRSRANDREPVRRD